MWKIKSGVAAAGGVLVVIEWLMLSHTFAWLTATVLPH